jgi:hypothetical protein
MCPCISSFPLGNMCMNILQNFTSIQCTQNNHTINVIQPVQYHHTYAPRPILGNIVIPIRLAQSIHPSQCYACFCFISCFCLIGINLASEASIMFLRHLPSCVHPSGIHTRDRSLALWHQPFIRHQPSFRGVYLLFPPTRHPP